MDRAWKQRFILVSCETSLDDWNIFGKTLELHSLVHGRQVEGIFLFAERIKWPYINEVRDYAEDAYSSLRSGQTIPFLLHDWLFGMTLPGKWMSFKIMSVLILCTPSITADMEIAHQRVSVKESQGFHTGNLLSDTVILL